MTIIDDNTIVIFSNSELKTILEGENTYTYIYFGDNIILTDGIKINSNKENIIIDGTYDGVTYKFEGKKSLSANDTIMVSSKNNLNVKVCNMNIIAYNYYGVIYVPDSATYKNTIVEYNNITYSGPQISFHPTGLTRFITSNITISDNDITVGNEVAECNQIEIGGNTVIKHNSKSNSAFWFRNANPSFKILENANVRFESEYRELFYGTNDLNFMVLKNSYFYLTSYRGMAYSTFGTSLATIEPGSTFIIKQTNTNGGSATWYSYGPITVDNASLIIINDFANISSSNYNISFTNSKGSLVFKNPIKIVLYNSGANIIRCSNTILFDFSFSRINLFVDLVNINDNISSSTIPTYSWYKEVYLSTISGSFSSSTTKIDSNNYTVDELKDLPSLEYFNFANKKILSIGKLNFVVNSLTDKDTSISGITKPNASILIEYNDVSDVVLADDTGKFNYSYSEPLPIGTVITFNIKEYNDLIYVTKVIQIVYSGELILESATKTLTFKLSPISLDPLLCPRNEELNVTVIDSRVVSSEWKLYVRLEHDLMSSNGVILKNALIFLDENKNLINLSENPTLVYTGSNNGGNVETIVVKWDEQNGILLNVKEPLINNLEYKTTLIWSIEE